MIAGALEERPAQMRAFRLRAKHELRREVHFSAYILHPRKGFAENSSLRGSIQVSLVADD